MPQRGTENRRFSENVIGTDKSALLWMFCREIAPFETPTFSKKVGELIARATRACLQLSRMIAATKWTAARKFRASLSYRVAMAR